MSAQLGLRELERHTIEQPTIARRFQLIDEQTRKLARLVTRLLEISRFESGQLALDCEPTDLVRLVQQICESEQATADQHEITFASPSTLVASVDPLRLEQVVVNLIENAIKYSPNGGSVAVDLSQPKPNTAQLTVSDRGVGIPPDHREQIFTRFYRLQRDRTPGMGLGLFISRQLVELHGGQINVESPAEGGTRFIVTLPLIATPSD